MDQNDTEIILLIKVSMNLGGGRPSIMVDDWTLETELNADILDPEDRSEKRLLNGGNKSKVPTKKYV